MLFRSQVMRTALLGSRHRDTSLLTLHGMRRGAAQAALEGGATVQEVMDLGTWLSSSVYSYVPRPVARKASRALSSVFGVRALARHGARR